jgi:hypothetical protein
MQKLAAIGALLMLGCSGSSSGDKGAIDPAAEDFCLQWANDECRLAYLCTDAAAQDATFHARFGSSMDDCWQGLEQRCKSNQNGSGAFGPSCGPGKSVNATAATACADNLPTQSCTTWTAAPAGGCDAVCSSTPTGTGTGTGTGTVATAADFCMTRSMLGCDRVFECDPSSGAAVFGNVAGCKATTSADCTANPKCTMSYDPTLAAGCIAAIKAATCADLMGPTPTVCTSACK